MRDRLLSACLAIACAAAGLSCARHVASSDLAPRIEKQLRAFYNLRPDVRVKLNPLKPSEFPNYDTLTVTLESSSRRQDLDFLLSKDQKTLVRWAKLDLSRDPQTSVAKDIEIDGRPVRGNKDAKVRVVVWNDFECPFCARMHRLLFGEMMREYGDQIAIIYKDFPLSEIHPWAIHAAVDANCLAAQSNEAYWAFADRLHGNQETITSEKDRDAQLAALDRLTLVEAKDHGLDANRVRLCVEQQKADRVSASIAEGGALGVEATPTLFVNGRKLEGIRTFAELKAILEDALNQAGRPVEAKSADGRRTRETRSE